MTGKAARTAGIGKMLLAAVAAFAFTFSLVPIYRIACEKVFGIRLDGSVVSESAAVSATPVAERWVTVEFDATVNSRLPWSFRPNETRMRVQVGQQYETTYYAHNDSTAAATSGNRNSEPRNSRAERETSPLVSSRRAPIASSEIGRAHV